MLVWDTYVTPRKLKTFLNGFNELKGLSVGLMRAVSRLEDYTYVDRQEDNCISRVYSCATLEISYLTNSFSKVRFDLIIALGESST